MKSLYEFLNGRKVSIAVGHPVTHVRGTIAELFPEGVLIAQENATGEMFTGEVLIPWASVETIAFYR